MLLVVVSPEPQNWQSKPAAKKNYHGRNKYQRSTIIIAKSFVKKKQRDSQSLDHGTMPYSSYQTHQLPLTAKCTHLPLPNRLHSMNSSKTTSVKATFADPIHPTLLPSSLLRKRMGSYVQSKTIDD